MNIVVWEVVDDLNASWNTFSPEDCVDIESAYQKYLQNGSRYTDKHHTGYQCHICFTTMEELNSSSYVSKPVRRLTFPHSSPLAQKISWQWNASTGTNMPAHWISYPADVIEFIEEHFQNYPNALLDLKRKFPDLNYTVDVTQNFQINNITKYSRPIQRIILKHSYPLDTVSAAKPSTSNNHQANFPSHQWSSGAGLLANGAASNAPNVVSPFAGSALPNTSNNGNPLNVTPRPKPRKSKQKKAHLTSRKRSSGGGPSTVGTSQNSLAKWSDDLSLERVVESLPRYDLANGLTQWNRLFAVKFTPRLLLHCNDNPRVDINVTLQSSEGFVYRVFCMGNSISINLPVAPDLQSFATAVSSPSNDSCSICLIPLDENSGFSQGTSGSSPSSSYASVVQLKNCKHDFHSECLSAAVKNDKTKSSMTCPTCKTIYGVKTGTQPKGTMTHRTTRSSLPGHPGCGTIVITYNFGGGIQGADHPHPGQRYHAHSFPRTAYLPDNREGQKVHALLKVAWERRLIFTIGQSVTTGADNVITWNEIHHKTETGPYHSGHGYPDPNYLANVTNELKQQGVTEADLQ